MVRVDNDDEAAFHIPGAYGQELDNEVYEDVFTWCLRLWI